MPKISVYLPDELYRRARELELPVSALTQAAIRAELDRDPNAAWIRRARTRAPRFRARIDTPELLDEVREDFGT
ncbi:MAG: type II toxin-antitoxin system CcdA family antitoxin [Nitriliruptoraceae bacterium]